MKEDKSILYGLIMGIIIIGFIGLMLWLYLERG